jgi:phage terminase small subunit
MGALTPKQERFACLYVLLGNASEAYRQAYEPKTMSAKTINETASRLVSHHKVAARIAQLQAVAERAVIQEIVYGVKEAMAEASRAIVLAESLNKPEAMISGVRLKADLKRLIVRQEESGKAGPFANLPTDPKEQEELLKRIDEERAARAAKARLVVVK